MRCSLSDSDSLNDCHNKDNKTGHITNPFYDCHELQLQWTGSIMVGTQELSVDAHSTH